MTAVEQCLSLRDTLRTWGRSASDDWDTGTLQRRSSLHDVCEHMRTEEPWRQDGITTRAGERLSGDSGMRRTKTLPTIHFATHVLDHVLQVGFRFRTIAAQLIEIVRTTRNRLGHIRLHRRLERQIRLRRLGWFGLRLN